MAHNHDTVVQAYADQRIKSKIMSTKLRQA